MAVSERKKQYMKNYNSKPTVKAKKAEHMRKVRSEQEIEAARNVVRLFLKYGFESLAEVFALERAPEMLATAKIRRRMK